MSMGRAILLFISFSFFTASADEINSYVSLNVGLDNQEVPNSFGTSQEAIIALSLGYEINEIFSAEFRIGTSLDVQDEYVEIYERKGFQSLNLISKKFISNHFSPYLKLGYSRNEFKVDYFYIYDDSTIGTKNETQTGLLYGIGNEFHISNSLRLNIEYVRTKLDEKADTYLLGLKLNF